MATFKVKHDKTKHLIQINTLDETHKKIMKSFENRKIMLPKKKKKLGLLQNQLEKIEKTNASYYSTNDIKKRSLLKITKHRKKKIVNPKQINILDFFNSKSQINENTTVEEFIEVTETELDFDNDCDYENVHDSHTNQEITIDNDENFKIKNKAELLD